MKEAWLKLKEWWSNLALREKRIVGMGGALVAIFIAYAGIWMPYLDYIASLRNRILTDQKTLLWMQAADQEIQKIETSSKNKSKNPSPVVLLSFLQKSIQQAGLEQYLTQLKQTSNEAIEINFQKVEFDKLIKLLMMVVQAQKVAISQLSVIAESTPGVVNADVVVSF